MGDEEVPEISHHALERFKERWEILNGKPLEEGDVLSKLWEIIISAKPEPENPALAERKKKYGGEDCYMICGPWRLVWHGNQLITVELQKQGLFLDPRLYPRGIRAEFYLRITEGEEIWIDKAVSKDFSKIEVLSLMDQPEVNAIIRFLRLVGVDVAHKKTGIASKEQAYLRILLPKIFRQWKIEKTEGRKIWLRFPDHDESFPIAGIGEEDCRQIFSFVTDEIWIQNMEAAQKFIDEGEKPTQKRAETKRMRREKQKRRLREKNIRPGRTGRRKKRGQEAEGCEEVLGRPILGTLEIYEAP